MKSKNMSLDGTTLVCKEDDRIIRADVDGRARAWTSRTSRKSSRKQDSIGADGISLVAKEVKRDVPCGDDEVRGDDAVGILEGVGHPAKNNEYTSARIEPEQKVLHSDERNTDMAADCDVDIPNAQLLFGKRARELSWPTSCTFRRKLKNMGTDGIPWVLNEDDVEIRDDKDKLDTFGVKRVSRDSDEPCGDAEVRADDADGILEGVGQPAKDIEYMSERIDPEQKVVHFDDINTAKLGDS